MVQISVSTAPVLTSLPAVANVASPESGDFALLLAGAGDPPPSINGAIEPAPGAGQPSPGIHPMVDQPLPARQPFADNGKDLPESVALAAGSEPIAAMPFRADSHGPRLKADTPIARARVMAVPTDTAASAPILLAPRFVRDRGATARPPADDPVRDDPSVVVAALPLQPSFTTALPIILPAASEGANGTTALAQAPGGRSARVSAPLPMASALVTLAAAALEPPRDAAVSASTTPGVAAVPTMLPLVTRDALLSSGPVADPLVVQISRAPDATAPIIAVRPDAPVSLPQARSFPGVVSIVRPPNGTIAGSGTLSRATVLAHDSRPAPSPAVLRADRPSPTSAIARAAPVEPLALPIGVPLPAARAFAAAIAAAARPVARRVAITDEAVVTNPAPVAATPDIATRHTATLAQGDSIDTTHEDWTRRLVDHIEALRDAADARDTRIRLVPHALGKIDVAVRQEGDTLHVRFTAEAQATRTLLADAQPRLAEIAESRGLKLGESAVNDGSANANAHRQAFAPAPQPIANRSNPADDERTATIADHRLA